MQLLSFLLLRSECCHFLWAPSYGVLCVLFLLGRSGFVQLDPGENGLMTHSTNVSERVLDGPPAFAFVRAAPAGDTCNPRRHSFLVVSLFPFFRLPLRLGSSRWGRGQRSARELVARDAETGSPFESGPGPGPIYARPMLGTDSPDGRSESWISRSFCERKSSVRVG
jgi:hypothetical protein